MSDPDGSGTGDTATIRMVLDASALCAYGEHESVGELIGEIAGEESGATFATTTAALAEALARGADATLLEVLCNLPGCVVITSTGSWRDLGTFMALTRPADAELHDLADSDLALLAVVTDAYVLTERPDRYTAITPLVLTIRLEEPWSG